MRWSSTGARVLIVAAISASVGLFALFRLNRTTPENDPAGYWASQARPIFARMRAVPFTDSEALRSLVEGCTIEDDEGIVSTISGGDTALRQSVLMFLEARFTSTSIDEYIARMSRSGYRFKTGDEFEA